MLATLPDFPQIATQGNHFVVHCDEHATIVEDDLGPLDKARAQYWLDVMRERAKQLTAAVPQGVE